MHDFMHACMHNIDVKSASHGTTCDPFHHDGSRSRGEHVQDVRSNLALGVQQTGHCAAPQPQAQSV